MSRATIESEVQVGALAHGPQEVGTGIAEIEIHRLGLGIDRHAAPGGSAAALPRIAAPGVVAGLARGRDRRPAPDLVAVLRVVRGDVAQPAPIAGGDAEQQPVLVGGGVVIGHRRHRVEGVGGVVDGHLVPDLLAVLGVQRDQVAVERGDVDVAVEQRDAAVGGEGDDVRVVLELPLQLAGGRIQRIDVVVRRRHVHGAVVDDRRVLHRPRIGHLELPGEVQAARVVAVDLHRAGVVIPEITLCRQDPVRGVGRGVHELLRARRGLGPGAAGAEADRHGNTRDRERQMRGTGLQFGAESHGTFFLPESPSGGAAPHSSSDAAISRT